MLTVLIHWEIKNEKADEAAAADFKEAAVASEHPKAAEPTTEAIITTTENKEQTDYEAASGSVTAETASETSGSEDSKKETNS